MSAIPIQNESRWKEIRLGDIALPLFGVATGLLISGLLFSYWLDMNQTSMLSMVMPFGYMAILTNGISIFLYYLMWFYSRSVRWTALVTSLLVGGLTIANGGFAAQQMYFGLNDPVILKDAAILLIFATIISLAFNLMGYTRLTRNLNRLHRSATEISSGNFKARTSVDGRDEIAQLGLQFNQMAFSLEQAEIERAKLEKMRRDLTAWVSHDLRTPLTSIRAIVEALNDGIVTDPADTKRYYNTILQDILGLNHLIDELFEMAQLDAKETDMPRQLIDVGEMVRMSVDALAPVALKNHVRILHHIAPDLQQVCANPEKINRVFNNIISNALKYTPAAGSITVTVSPSLGKLNEATVSIIDTGSGFNPDDIPYLFDQFYRGDNARSRTKTGSAGLGLAIARSIVEAHHGTIWASNARNGGAKISFTLPTTCQEQRTLAEV